jgi:predicted DCC family thiol-disulfide oxidoreductase YuxK
VRDVTVLYDDRCALCASLTRPLGSLEGVSLAPIRSGRAAELLRDLAPDDRQATLHVVDADGTRRSGAEALPHLARRLRGGAAAAWVLERFPGTTARAYDLVAHNRMLLSRPFAAAQQRVVSRR